ncbi:mitochondrial ribosomal small subunit component [Kappamyces sp. JEL0829]|nr:mitochondrial ribosomal small subunit component [Kappamyces sp. JEL0829]
MKSTLTLLGKRSLWKGPFFVPFPTNVPVAEGAEAPIIKTMARSSTILPSHVGKRLRSRHRFGVHNGKTYTTVYITEMMVSKKLGEFAPTRKPFSFKKKDAKGR